MTFKYNLMRILDVEDIIILSLINKGYSFRKIAQELEVSPTNITYRQKRYKRIWPDFGFIKDVKGYKVNETGKKICESATKALEVLKSI